MGAEETSGAQTEKYEETGETCIKKEKLHDLFFSPNIIWAIK
jgi:hypothetical protein